MENSPISPQQQPSDSLDAALRIKRLDELYGQDKVRNNLEILIEATRKRQDNLDHILLYGPPGLGKTTIAHIVANEMDVNLKVTAGPAIERAGDLAAILTNLRKHDILFIDEIHRLGRAVEEILYPAMEDFALDIIIGKGPSARNIRLKLPRFTVIGATTRLALITAPLRARFGAVMRFDFYDPGLPSSRLGNEWNASTFQEPKDHALLSRMKKQISPRIGMAYPISDRDVLHFHYGRFYQLPLFERMYKGLGQSIEQDGGLYGNIFLKPEQTISYEFGVDHQLTDVLNLDMTIFFKDIFGWIDSYQITNGSLASFGNQAPVGYINQAYGTVKGLEFKLSRKLSNKFGGSIVYTLSRAKGTQSEDNSQVLVGTGVLDRKPLTESPLNWAHTHSLVLNLLLTDPGVWQISMDYIYETGSPYSPLQYQQRSVRADEMNSERLPEESRLDIRANKLYSIYGPEFRLIVDGTNLLNKEHIRQLNPDDWPSNEGLHTVYYTETGQLGGAYNLNEVNSSAGNQFIPLNDPRVLDPKRRVKVGIMFDW